MRKSDIGKLVVVAQWGDFKLEDSTKLGILERIEANYFYIVGDHRGYRHCRLVSNRIPKAIDTAPKTR